MQDKKGSDIQLTERSSLAPCAKEHLAPYVQCPALQLRQMTVLYSAGSGLLLVLEPASVRAILPCDLQYHNINDNSRSIMQNRHVPSSLLVLLCRSQPHMATCNHPVDLLMRGNTVHAWFMAMVEVPVCMKSHLPNLLKRSLRSAKVTGSTA